MAHIGHVLVQYGHVLVQYGQIPDLHLLTKLIILLGIFAAKSLSLRKVWVGGEVLLVVVQASFRVQLSQGKQN